LPKQFFEAFFARFFIRLNRNRQVLVAKNFLSLETILLREKSKKRIFRAIAPALRRKTPNIGRFGAQKLISWRKTSV
jgi:hypothetical protein